MQKQILLPGTDKQLHYVLHNSALEGKRILVVGAVSEIPAKALAEKSGITVDLIVEDFDSLINSKILLEGITNVRPRLMVFDATDFEDEEFDIIYSQGSVSIPGRNKIVKEFKRILKPEGLIFSGEFVLNESEPPPFILELLEANELDPILRSDITNYYKSRKLEVLDVIDLSKTLKDYYKNTREALIGTLKEMTEKEQSYYKKLINKISHESNVYLVQGGERYLGFVCIRLRKN